jgi:hypothetical protein
MKEGYPLECENCGQIAWVETASEIHFLNHKKVASFACAERYRMKFYNA